MWGCRLPFSVRLEPRLAHRLLAQDRKFLLGHRLFADGEQRQVPPGLDVHRRRSQVHVMESPAKPPDPASASNASRVAALATLI